MTKFGSFDKYPPRSLASAEAALLTAWRSLTRYEDDLVLIGGLAVHYLTRKDVAGLPGAVTMDVDFGISLAAESGQYGTIQSDLSGLGFMQKNSRWEQDFDGMNLYIDFLSDAESAAGGSRMVDGTTVSLIPGINRALAKRRKINVPGKDLCGVHQACEINVADIGPLLVLKLNAFGGPTGRRAHKDAYDVLLAVTGFVDGPEAAIAAFHAEASAGNSAFASARKCLRKDFIDPDQDGPARAAAFHPGSTEERQRVRQATVTVGKMLFGN